MPQIEEFQAGTGQVDVSDRGAESFAQAGRRANVAFKDIGADIDRTLTPMGQVFIQHQTDMDISNAYKSFSDAKMNGLDGWNKAIADPAAMDHPELGKAFLDEYSQQLDTIASHATTQQGKILAMRLATEQKEQMYGRVADDMSGLAVAKWSNNHDQFVGNTLGAIQSDPSSADANIDLLKRFDTDTIPSNVQGPERAALLRDHMAADMRQAASTYYGSLLQRGTEQAAAGQPTTALDQASKDLAANKFYEFLGDPEGAAFIKDLPERIDIARQRGQEQFKVGQEAQQKGLELEGKAYFATLSTKISDAVAAGQPVTADMLKERDAGLAKYGSILPGEVASTNDLIRSAVHAQANHEYTVTDPHVSANFISRLGIPAGQPGALSEAELVKAKASGALSDSDYSMFHEALPKVDGDPAMKNSLEGLRRWQETMKSQIEGTGGALKPGAATAYAQFIHDSTQTFLGWAQSQHDPGQALEIMTNANNPKSFVSAVSHYARAANSTHPLAVLGKDATYQAYARTQGIIADGSTLNPISGPTPSPSAAAQTEGAGAVGPLDAKTSGDMSKIAGGN